jgi:hypothetical protein
MKLADLVSTFALLTAVTALAQTQRTPSQLTPGSTVAEVTIRGCMQPGAERTTLTDSRSTTYVLRQTQVSSKSRTFVEVHGQELSPAGQHGEAALPRFGSAVYGRYPTSVPSA